MTRVGDFRAIGLEAMVDRNALSLVGGKMLQFADAQTIAMSDAALTLDVDGNTSGATTITSNILFVDAESGSSEVLTLPVEADCSGLQLIIVNTGGEDIVVKDDAGSPNTICTVATTEIGLVFCDGTTWYGGVIKTT